MASRVTIALAKLAAIQKAVDSRLTENTSRNPGRGFVDHARHFPPSAVAHYFQQASDQLGVLRQELPDWFDDFQPLAVTADIKMATSENSNVPNYFSKARLERLSRDIGQVFEIRANSEPAVAERGAEVPYTVFVSHGRAKDWYEVQAHIKKDLGIKTKELAQEASAGSTIIEKLEATAALCDAAVIVMSGDDTDSEGQARVRENVMHEIGYFQGRYGRSKVVLLHEEGVHVPTNLAGIVYVPYPKAAVSAGFGVLGRELRAIYKR